MKRLYAPSCAAASLNSLTPSQLMRLTTFLNGSDIAELLDDWSFWARKEQLPPERAWRTWLFLGGRGAGKTRAGAQWVSAQARYGRARRIALIGPTFHDVREVMVDGPSGLRSLADERPAYEASRRRLLWRNGAEALCFSAEDPEGLRGPQFDAAWADELCVWPYPEETLTTLAHGMRLGRAPQLMVTTTPRPIGALKALMARKDTALTQSSSWDNRHNVAPDFIAALSERWAGTAYHRQELLGELVEDIDGAVWRRSDLEALRVRELPRFDRIVVAVDPPASVGAKADACGIVAAGACGEGRAHHAVVLADATAQGLHPHQWAARAADLARALKAHAIVAEGNNGGEMVRAVLQTAAPDIPVRLVRASEGKRARAEPIAALYAQGRVKHAAAFPALEDEMCAFGADDFRGSPDRVDALVWALTDLLCGAAGPRMRVL